MWLWTSLAFAGAEMAPIAFGELRLDGETVGDDDVVDEIVGRLRDAGIEVEEGSPALFDSADRAVARLVLSGEVDAFSHQERTRYREVQLIVDWEVVDRRTRDVVYRTSTTGYVVRKPGLSTTSTLAAGAIWITSYVPDQDVWAVLDDAVDRLAERPAFRELLTVPDTPAETAAPRLAVRRCADVRALPTELEGALGSAVTISDSEGFVGSGVVISPDGWTLTAAHVMDAVRGDPAAKLLSGPSIPATEVRRDHDSDLSLLKLAGTGFTCSPLAAERPTVGSSIWAVGTPLDTALELSVAKGIVSGVRKLQGFETLQTDASISPGYSGGPMLLEDGTVGAITSSKIVGLGAEGIAFGIPPAVARTALAFTESDVSDPLPSAGQPRPARGTVDDPEDPSRYGELDEPTRTRLRKGARSTIAVGAITSGVGLAISATAFGAYMINDHKTLAGLKTLRGVDVLGGSMVAVGVPLLAIGGANLGLP